MLKGKNRFVVDKEGHVTDRRLELEAENYAAREAQREAEAKRVRQEIDKRRDEITRECEQKFLRQEEYKQSKNGLKLASLVCGLGVLSLEEAFRSGGGLASGWGLLGLFVVLFGAIFLVMEFVTRAGGPPS